MIIAGYNANIIDSIITFESCIKWTSMNSRIKAEDAGAAGDHLKTKLSLWERIEKLNELRNALRVSEPVSIQANPHEYPFGVAYNCEQSDCIILSIGDVITEQMNVGVMELELAAADMMQWKHDCLPFTLSNFAVTGINRKTEESKTNIQKGEGWSTFRHGWNRPEISLALTANSSVMGGTLRWLAEINRNAPFEIICNPSMMLTDTNKITVVCTAWGNLRRIGNSCLWECEFEMTGVEDAG